MRRVWPLLRVVLLAAVFALAIALIGGAVGARVVSRAAVPIAMLLAVLVSLRLDRMAPHEIGLAPLRPTLAAMVRGAAWAAPPAGLLVFLLRGDAPFLPTTTGYGRHLAGGAIWALLVGWGEELLFRGYLLARLARWPLARWPRILVAAGLFAAVHVVNPEYGAFAFGYAFAVGVVLGLAVTRARSVALAAGYHVAFNLLQDAFWVLPAQGGELAHLASIGLMVVFLPLATRPGAHGAKII